ncbi:hypothetical protein HDU97_008321, partial [Phlyctochytrium planicorne]
YRAPCDVFSFGVILTEIGSWLGPYTLPVEDLRYEVLHRILTVDKQIPELEFDESTPAAFVELAMKCLSIEPAERPSFVDVVKVLGTIQDGLPAVSVQNAVVDTMVFDVTETRVSEPLRAAISNLSNGQAYSIGSTAYAPTVNHAPIPPPQMSEATSPTLEPTQSTTPLLSSTTETSEILQAVQAMSLAFNKPNTEPRNNLSENQKQVAALDRETAQHNRNANMEARKNILESLPDIIKAQGGTPIVVQIPPAKGEATQPARAAQTARVVVTGPTYESLRRDRRRFRIGYWIALVIFSIVFVFVLVLVVFKRRIDNNGLPPPPQPTATAAPSPSFLLVNADGKCLKGLEIAECNQQDDGQIFDMDEVRIKNKGLQACMTRSNTPEFISQGFQFPLQYSTCQRAGSYAQLQPGRIEFYGFCVSSKDVKYRTCTSDREFTWTQKFI